MSGMRGLEGRRSRGGAVCAPLAFLPLAVAVAAAGCATRSGAKWLDDHSTREIVISEEQIAASGAQTAWDAIRRHVASFTTSERRDGTPSRLQRRGKSSIYLSDAPVVFLDGVRLADFRALDLVPARDIHSIRILSGIEGTTQYGTNAGNGVILIQTKS